MWAAEVRRLAHRHVELSTSDAAFTFFGAVTSKNIQHLPSYASCIRQLTFEFDAIGVDSEIFWCQAAQTLAALERLNTLVIQFSHLDRQSLSQWGDIASSLPDSLKCLKMEPRSNDVDFMVCIFVFIDESDSELYLYYIGVRA